MAKKYPTLMREKTLGFVVLFTSKRVGTVVFDADSVWPLGEYREDWFTTGFEPFEGKIVFKQKKKKKKQKV